MTFQLRATASGDSFVASPTIIINHADASAGDYLGFINVAPTVADANFETASRDQVVQIREENSAKKATFNITGNKAKAVTLDARLLKNVSSNASWSASQSLTYSYLDLSTKTLATNTELTLGDYVHVASNDVGDHITKLTVTGDNLAWSSGINQNDFLANDYNIRTIVKKTTDSSAQTANSKIKIFDATNANSNIWVVGASTDNKTYDVAYHKTIHTFTSQDADDSSTNYAVDFLNTAQLTDITATGESNEGAENSYALTFDNFGSGKIRRWEVSVNGTLDETENRYTNCSGTLISNNTATFTIPASAIAAIGSSNLHWLDVKLFIDQLMFTADIANLSTRTLSPDTPYNAWPGSLGITNATDIRAGDRLYIERLTYGDGQMLPYTPTADNYISSTTGTYSIAITTDNNMEVDDIHLVGSHFENLSFSITVYSEDHNEDTPEGDTNIFSNDSIIDFFRNNYTVSLATAIENCNLTLTSPAEVLQGDHTYTLTFTADEYTIPSGKKFAVSGYDGFTDNTNVTITESSGTYTASFTRCAFRQNVTFTITLVDDE